MTLLLPSLHESGAGEGKGKTGGALRPALGSSVRELGRPWVGVPEAQRANPPPRLEARLTLLPGRSWAMQSFL